MKNFLTRFIIQSNKWYEDLPSIKGGLFYIGLVFIPYAILIFTIKNTFGSFFALSWILIVIIWRSLYKLINIKK